MPAARVTVATDISRYADYDDPVDRGAINLSDIMAAVSAALDGNTDSNGDDDDDSTDADNGPNDEIRFERRMREIDDAHKRARREIDAAHERQLRETDNAMREISDAHERRMHEINDASIVAGDDDI